MDSSALLADYDYVISAECYLMESFWFGWYFYPAGERIPVPIAPVFSLENIR